MALARFLRAIMPHPIAVVVPVLVDNGCGRWRMSRWLQSGKRRPRSSSSAVLGALDQFFNPGAARARELLDAQHERVMPNPSPGDKLLDEGRIVIERPEP